MALTTAGQEYIATKIFDGTGNLFDNTNAYIGVGASITAFAITQTDLLTTPTRKAMDATFPTLTGTPLVDLTLQSTFATGDANIDWNEWGVFNAAAAGTMLSRKVEDLGTKTSAQTWEITVVISILIGA